MSAFNPSTDLPTGIDTLEKLLQWAVEVAAFLHTNSQYKELKGNAVDDGFAPLIDVSYITAYDGTRRAIARMSVELDPEYNTATSPLWEYAREWNNAPIPARFKPQ